MWLVRARDELYVRSARGPANGWFVRALRAGPGRIRAGGSERDVVFAEPTRPDVDAAYHAKYDRYGPATLGSDVGEKAHDVTIRPLPRD